MPEQITEDKVTIQRKKLIFRSWHRGTREIDLLLGRFADTHLSDFDEAQLTQYDRMLNNSDPDLYNWITGAEPVPPAEDCKALQLLVAFTIKGLGSVHP